MPIGSTVPEPNANFVFPRLEKSGPTFPATVMLQPKNSSDSPWSANFKDPNDTSAVALSTLYPQLNNLQMHPAVAQNSYQALYDRVIITDSTTQTTHSLPLVSAPPMPSNYNSNPVQFPNNINTQDRITTISSPGDTSGIFESSFPCSNWSDTQEVSPGAIYNPSQTRCAKR